MRFFATFLTGALLVSSALPVAADQAADTAALKALFASPKVDPAAFTTAFIQQVQLDGVQSFVDSYKERLGVPTAYTIDGTQYRIVSPKGSIGCNIALDQTGKISNLI